MLRRSGDEGNRRVLRQGRGCEGCRRNRLRVRRAEDGKEISLLRFMTTEL